MHRRVSTALFVLVISCTFAPQAKALEDRELAAKLVGTWMIRPDEYWPAWVSGISIFRSNGTVVSSGSIKIAGRSLPIEVEGNWRVVKGVLVEEVTKSSVPDFLAVGHISRDAIVAVTDEECWLRGQNNQKDHFLTRYNR
jgi:hypothetical protein